MISRSSSVMSSANVGRGAMSRKTKVVTRGSLWLAPGRSWSVRDQLAGRGRELGDRGGSGTRRRGRIVEVEPGLELGEVGVELLDEVGRGFVGGQQCRDADSDDRSRECAHGDVFAGAAGAL